MLHSSMAASHKMLRACKSIQPRLILLGSPSLRKTNRLLSTSTAAPAGRNFYRMFAPSGGQEDVVPKLQMSNVAADDAGDVSTRWLSLHSGTIGHLADASVMCRYGDTVVHVAVSTKPSENPTSDFLPLTVDYRNKAYAHGVIPGSINRRERAQDEEILVARIIDRCVRPLFPKGYTDEVQLTITAHSIDSASTSTSTSASSVSVSGASTGSSGGDPVVASIVAASYALRKSSQPWYLLPSSTNDAAIAHAPAAGAALPASFAEVGGGVIGCVRLGLIGGRFVSNPTTEQLAESEMNLLYAATTQRPLMIEFNGNEVPEATVKEGLRVAQVEVGRVIEYQMQLLRLEAQAEAEAEAEANAGSMALFGPTKHVKKPWIALPQEVKDGIDGYGRLKAVQVFMDNAAAALGKEARGKAEGGVRGELTKWLETEGAASLQQVQLGGPSSELHPLQKAMAVDHVLSRAFRGVSLVTARRGDGRGAADVREVGAVVDVLPAPVHGSAVFRRGDTHVLCSTTLGAKSDAKTSYPIHGPTRAKSSGGGGGGGGRSTSRGPVLSVDDTFMLHYDFPPYCTNDVGSASSLNRRMVGHGFLAEKALKAIIPPFSVFPYSIRLVAECTSSSGSSSMASVCGGTLALLDAGVPIRNLVAGASVGLITGEAYRAHPGSATDEEMLLSSAADKSNSQVCATPQEVLEAATPTAYRLLTDIIGSEDYYGDMDFKIAGSKEGITAMQLDVKLPYGVPLALVQSALDAALAARSKIIDNMTAAVESTHELVPYHAAPAASVAPHTAKTHGAASSTIPHRAESNSFVRTAAGVKPHAPISQVVTVSGSCDPAIIAEKKKKVVGPYGEMTRFIEDTYGVTVDTSSDDNSIYVFGHAHSNDVPMLGGVGGAGGGLGVDEGVICSGVANNVQEATMLIKDLVGDISVGEVFPMAEIVEVREFGMIVRLTKSQDAMLHISELSHFCPMLQQASSLVDIFHVGQVLPVVVLQVDKATGLVRVSRKQLKGAASGANEEEDTLDDIRFPESRGGNATSGSAGKDVQGSAMSAKNTANLPTFPVIPPRKYDANYFRTQVATQEDVEKAKLNGGQPPQTKPAPKSKSNSKRSKHSGSAGGSASGPTGTAKREFSTMRSVRASRMPPPHGLSCAGRTHLSTGTGDRSEPSGTVEEAARAAGRLQYHRVQFGDSLAQADADATAAADELYRRTIFDEDNVDPADPLADCGDHENDDDNVLLEASPLSPYHVTVKYKTTPTGYDAAEAGATGAGAGAGTEAEAASRELQQQLMYQQHTRMEWQQRFSSTSVLQDDMRLIDDYLQAPQQQEVKASREAQKEGWTAGDRSDNSIEGKLKALYSVISKSIEDVLREEQQQQHEQPRNSSAPHGSRGSADEEDDGKGSRSSSSGAGGRASSPANNNGVGTGAASSARASVGAAAGLTDTSEDAEQSRRDADLGICGGSRLRDILELLNEQRQALMAADTSAAVTAAVAASSSSSSSTSSTAAAVEPAAVGEVAPAAPHAATSAAPAEYALDVETVNMTPAERFKMQLLQVFASYNHIIHDRKQPATTASPPSSTLGEDGSAEQQYAASRHSSRARVRTRVPSSHSSTASSSTPRVAPRSGKAVKRGYQ